MFLKKDTLEFNGASVVLNELSALQRAEYFEFLAAREAAMTEAEASLGQTAQWVRVNVEVNAWLVSRSLWHNTPERAEEDVYREVLKTWPTGALNQAVGKVLTLSDMMPAEKEAGDEETQNDGEDETPLAK